MEIGNGVTFIGRLTKDIELKESNGTKYVYFTLARNRRKTAKNQNPESDFIDFTAFGLQAEFASKHFKKGERVGVYGRIASRMYEKDGNKIKSTGVVVDGFEFIEGTNGSFKTNEGHDLDVPNTTASAPTESALNDSDDDLPF